MKAILLTALSFYHLEGNRDFPRIFLLEGEAEPLMYYVVEVTQSLNEWHFCDWVWVDESGTFLVEETPDQNPEIDQSKPVFLRLRKEESGPTNE